MVIVSYFDLGAVIASFSDLPSIVVIAIDVKDLVALHTEHTIVKNNEKIAESLKTKLKRPTQTKHTRSGLKGTGQLLTLGGDGGVATYQCRAPQHHTLGQSRP
jgi:hypothetical protein